MLPTAVDGRVCVGDGKIGGSRVIRFCCRRVTVSAPYIPERRNLNVPAFRSSGTPSRRGGEGVAVIAFATALASIALSTEVS